jgi:hypothetical protein
MLDAFVIEEIRRRERERGRDDRTGIQIPVPEPMDPGDGEKPPEEPSSGDHHRLRRRLRGLVHAEMRPQAAWISSGVQGPFAGSRSTPAVVSIR